MQTYPTAYYPPSDAYSAYIQSILGGPNVSNVVPTNGSITLPADTTTPAPAAPVIASTPAAVAAPAALPTPVAPTITDPTADYRKQLLSDVNSKFGVDYGQRNVASSLLDDTINQILSEQKQGANQYLERGHARGIYNDTGYNAGLASIGTNAEAGSAKLHGLGNSVIDKYRDDANAVRDQAYSAATAATPDNNFSLDPYINEGNEVIGRANQNASGDLRNAFGGTKLFDFGNLTNTVGQAQGVTNARDTDILGALANRRKANSFGRGLGSQGAF